MKKILTACALLLITPFATAGNDASIKGDLRDNIQAAMVKHIDHNQINGHYALFDAVTGKVLKLKLAELHSGIVSKGDYFVSCADFVDSKGNKYDVDFMVAPSNHKQAVFQAIVHKDKNGKRKYHLES